MGEVSPGRVGWSLITVVLVAMAAGAGWWAARATLTPVAENTAVADEIVTGTVVEGTVGRSLTVGVTLRQPVEVVATNTLAGMVTEVGAAVEVSTGEVIYAVAGVPVRVVQGQMPFYRDLARDARGSDVEQLQAALVELGHLSSEPDGIFGSATREAVRAWQDELGLERTGTVSLGEVLAVPQLPASVRLGDGIRAGVPVSGGEEAILASSGSQEFTLVLSADQAATITTEVPIRVSFEDLTWEARTMSSRVDENGNTVLDLVAPDGGPVCGQDCDRLPADEQLSLRAEAIVTPEVTGPVVPVTAVRTGTDAQAYVQMADGTHREVRVLGSGQGVAAVEGLEIGEQVVISGTEPVDSGSSEPQEQDDSTPEPDED